MKAPCLVAALAVCAATGLPTTPARATFHLWRFQEIFTNADGTVQFIEMVCPTGPGTNNEFFVSGQSLTAKSDSAATVPFPLTHGLTGQTSTSGQTFLFATAGYAALTGAVAADFGNLPTSFFNPNATSITLNFAGVDNLVIPGASLPKNGTQSLVDLSPNGSAQLVVQGNSPKNFLGQSQSINAAPPTAASDFNSSGSVNNADLDVWRMHYGQTGASRMEGDADVDQDVDGGDFLVWQQQVTAPIASGAASAAEHAACASLAASAAALLIAVARRRRRALHVG